MWSISDSIFEAGIASMLPPAPFYTSTHALTGPYTTVNGAFQDSRRSRLNPHADEARREYAPGEQGRAKLRGELDRLPNNDGEGHHQISRSYSDIPRAAWEERKLEGSGETLEQDLSPVSTSSQVPPLDICTEDEEVDNDDPSMVVGEDSASKACQSYAAITAGSLKKYGH
ncbi:hypothetical protein OE88DRAFT_1644799 [Heliocybe sulcata]|uniref:Uncharacterized protein n=1 Tax=Heliocybe sulcata TaxID=5364 RepID=A0A5C3N121_9AGAM|nr:hypothetical protein OE88DRAFT_1644799 [Heliocybe sulcata]